MRRPVRPSCLFLALVLGAVSASVPSAASVSGGLSSGVGGGLAGGLAAGGPTARSSQTDAGNAQIAAAIAQGDAARARRLLGQGDTAQRRARLRWLASDYLARYDALDALRLDLVRFLLEEGGLDVRGRTGTVLLQLAVSIGPADPALLPHRRARQLALARLAVAHGARADGILLGACDNCNAEPDFLALLIDAGADINASGPGVPALFDRVIETDDLAAAERLIRLGADPRADAHAQARCRPRTGQKQAYGCDRAVSGR